MTNPNDSAYPFDRDIPNLETGFTKYEEAHLRFMCAIVNGILSSGDNIYPETIAEEATTLTVAYFNEINKEK